MQRTIELTSKSLAETTRFSTSNLNYRAATHLETGVYPKPYVPWLWVHAFEVLVDRSRALEISGDSEARMKPGSVLS